MTGYFTGMIASFLNQKFDYENVYLVVMTNARRKDYSEFIYEPTKSKLCEQNSRYKDYWKQMTNSYQTDPAFKKPIFGKYKEDLVSSYGSTFINAFYYFSFECLFIQANEKKKEKNTKNNIN